VKFLADMGISTKTVAFPQSTGGLSRLLALALPDDR
jgi:hypothetical protein